MLKFSLCQTISPSVQSVIWSDGGFSAEEDDVAGHGRHQIFLHQQERTHPRHSIPKRGQDEQVVEVSYLTLFGSPRSTCDFKYWKSQVDLRLPILDVTDHPIIFKNYLTNLIYLYDGIIGSPRSTCDFHYWMLQTTQSFLKIIQVRGAIKIKYKRFYWL